MTLTRLLNGIARARLAGGRVLARWRVQVFYDGWCPFCRRTAATLQRLDRFGLLELHSFRDSAVLATYGLDAARAEARMQARAVRWPAASLAEGIDAVTLVASRVPLLWPAVPLLWGAGRLGLGQRVYDWVAARRVLIPAGCDTTCELAPPAQEPGLTRPAGGSVVGG
ncbi:MAG TPA: DUF393 domain-containing protein [Chloroflexota bacterium]|nr:DUF393 domain-containing protein [Chloroflexota bacterium]